MKKILIVIGTRPNFIKVTQFKKEAKKFSNIDLKMVHTGQHYDEKMSTVFFDQFELTPDYFLNIGQGSPNEQMAKIMLGLENIIKEFEPDILMVVGDVNSTFAAALTGNKMGIKIAHLESGLRSLDREMPEEINRLLTDEITNMYFVTEKSGITNLAAENKIEANIHFVGNTMIDTLVAFEDQIDKAKICDKLGLEKGQYALMTMHRPRNVDTKERLAVLVDVIKEVTKNMYLVFPIHPRTMERLIRFDFFSELESNDKLHFTEALDYFSFQRLIKHCKLVITDSGGIQEETSFRRIPCLTLRENTERPSTLEVGTNTLVKYNLTDFLLEYNKILKGNYKAGIIPELWDGKTTARILEILAS